MSTTPPPAADPATPSTSTAPGASLSPSAAPWIPKVPIMGGIAQTDATTFTPWTGGKPLASWTGLDPSASTVPIAPPQYRSNSVGSASKGYGHREVGLAKPFTKSSDLASFEAKVWKHLVANGLDSIAYIPDPVDSTKMIDVIRNHSRFSVESGLKLSAAQVLLYDSFDKSNDAQAITFLQNSLDDGLERELRGFTLESDPFPVVFLRLLKIIRSISIKRFENMKSTLKKIKPTDYPGQDLTEMTLAIKDIVRDLEAAGQYDHNLTSHILNSFLEAGGENNEDYRFKLRTLKGKLEDALLEIGYMSPVEKTKHMIQQKLTCNDICEVATAQYRAQLDDGEWPPARLPGSDSKAPPKAFGNLAAICGNDPKLVAQVYALIQSGAPGKSIGSSKASKENPCNNCGSPDHWANECPKKKGGGGGRNGGSNGGRNGGSQGGRGGGGPRSWKNTPPGPNDPKIKHANGKQFRWCAKCNRWSTTHDTNSHRGSVRSGGSRPQVNFALETPAAWNLTFFTSFSMAALMMIVGDFASTYLALDWYAVLWTLSSGCLGYSLSLLPGFWLYTWHSFASHWTHLVAPACWLLSLAFVWYGRWSLIRVPPDPMFHGGLGPGRVKSLLRTHRRRSGSPVRRPFRKRPPHHGMSRRVARRQPVDVINTHELLAGLQEFANSIGFRRVRRGGDDGVNVCRAPRPQRTRPWKKRPQKKPRYRPSHGKGMTQSQIEVLTSPVAKAYIAHAPLPNHLLTQTQALRAALLSQPETSSHLGKTQKYPVIWDSGASISISPCRSDFVGPIKKPPIGMRLQGIAKGLVIEGEGHVAWSFVDSSGMLRTLKVPAYLVSKAKSRLLSTTSLLQSYPDEEIHQQSDRIGLSGNKSKNLLSIEVLIDHESNLPIGWAYDHSSVPTTAHCAFNAAISVTSKANLNLSSAEKELLFWHCRLGHLHHRKIQFLMRTGVLAHSESARRIQTSAAKLEHGPLCAACQYGKQKRTPSPGKRSSVVRDNTGALKRDHLFPGQKVSVDHFICSTRGRLLHTHGKEDRKKQFSGGALFVDHSSGFIFCHPQVHMTTHETLASKTAFEATCRDFGVVVSEYLSDNGTAFTGQEYREHLTLFAQISSYAGVGAHHHNGVAERSIQTVMSIARTMMLHAAIHWPESANATLWPLAVAHACYVHNHVPNPSSGLCPQDLFSKTRWQQSKLQDLHVWGCPVYVLDSSMQDGRKLPRWKPRSSRMVYVGTSTKHASSIPLCLNLETGAITPQYHVVFDDNFSTVTSAVEDLPDFASPEWHNLFGDSVHQYVADEDDTSHVSSGTPPSPAVADRAQQVADAVATHLPPRPLIVAPPAERPAPPRSSPAPVPAPVSPPTPLRSPVPVPLPATSPSPSATSRPSPAPPVVDSPSAPTAPSTQGERNLSIPARKSPVVPKHPRVSAELKRLADHNAIGSQEAPVSTSRRTRRPPQRYANALALERFMSQNAPMEDPDLESFFLQTPLEPPGPSAHKARAVKDPDVLSLQEAMKSEDCEEWLSAMQAEIDALVDKGTWKEVPMSEATKKIIPGTWVLRYKRAPDGRIKKRKARYCVRGDLEEDDGSDNFAPVVNWSTVRLFLILSIMLKWKSISIDFSNAFVQAYVDKDVWIHIPRQFVSTKGPGTCLQLIKSLYGYRRSPLLWSKLALGAFKKCGFKQSTFDECLLFKPGMMIVLWVDDAGIAAKDPQDIPKLLQQLRDLGFELTEEESFHEFLGIQYEQRDDGSVVLTQKGLIQRILESADMVDCRPKFTPAAEPLGSDPNGTPMNESWHYRSIIGMMLYLASNTRPDIAFAVSQVARHSQDPKQSHAIAVKRIIRYLKHTANQGTVINPTNSIDLKLYVDADFCGLFGNEPPENPASAQSRCGYTMLLCDTPVACKSSLLKTICCSTMEAEYSALSIALRQFVPLRRLLVELLEQLQVNGDVSVCVRSTVFEDNQSAYLLATGQRITSRTRYMLNKWHWFWSLVGVEFEVKKVDTHSQLADYLTKALPQEPFERNRLSLQGW